MTDADARLSALLAYPAPPRTDPAFADRVVALAAHDLAARRARRRGFAQIAREALVLTAVLASFALLARAEPMLAKVAPGLAADPVVDLGEPHHVVIVGQPPHRERGEVACRPRGRQDHR